jgi:hypothetical protein
MGRRRLVGEKKFHSAKPRRRGIRRGDGGCHVLPESPPSPVLFLISFVVLPYSGDLPTSIPSPSEFRALTVGFVKSIGRALLSYPICPIFTYP